MSFVYLNYSLRMTVGTLMGLLASGLKTEDILKMYPYLQHQDIIEALTYAAWRSEEIEVPLSIDENTY